MNKKSPQELLCHPHPVLTWLSTVVAPPRPDRRATRRSAEPGFGGGCQFRASPGFISVFGTVWAPLSRMRAVREWQAVNSPREEGGAPITHLEFPLVSPFTTTIWHLHLEKN
jgi:hypothetical protein